MPPEKTRPLIKQLGHTSKSWPCGLAIRFVVSGTENCLCNERGLLTQPKWCTASRARAPPRQTRRVVVNEGRLRVPPTDGGPSFFSPQTAICKRDVIDYLYVTPHPSKSYTQVYTPRTYFSGCACDLVFAWCDDIVGRGRPPKDVIRGGLEHGGQLVKCRRQF